MLVRSHQHEPASVNCDEIRLIEPKHIDELIGILSQAAGCIIGDDDGDDVGPTGLANITTNWALRTHDANGQEIARVYSATDCSECPLLALHR